jgi:hypothetical protein
MHDCGRWPPVCVRTLTGSKQSLSAANGGGSNVDCPRYSGRRTFATRPASPRRQPSRIGAPRLPSALRMCHRWCANKLSALVAGAGPHIRCEGRDLRTVTDLRAVRKSLLADHLVVPGVSRART